MQQLPTSQPASLKYHENSIWEADVERCLAWAGAIDLLTCSTTACPQRRWRAHSNARFLLRIYVGLCHIALRLSSARAEHLPAALLVVSCLHSEAEPKDQHPWNPEAAEASKVPCTKERFAPTRLPAREGSGSQGFEKLQRTSKSRA